MSEESDNSVPMRTEAIGQAQEKFHLPALVDRAASVLAKARTAAEVLEALDMASSAYDAAKKCVRIDKAKRAHDVLVGASYRLQADALSIEARAKQRLADEYDAAQERGEINAHGVNRRGEDFKFADSKLEILKPSEIHEARIIRDAELAEPGIAMRVLNERVMRGEEPSRTALKEAVTAATRREAAPAHFVKITRGKEPSKARPNVNLYASTRVDDEIIAPQDWEKVRREEKLIHGCRDLYWGAMKLTDGRDDPRENLRELFEDLRELFKKDENFRRKFERETRISINDMSPDFDLLVDAAEALRNFLVERKKQTVHGKLRVVK